MKREVVAGVILVLLVLCISVFMLFHWNEIKERTVLRGVVHGERSKF